jgi:uncharacterized SAM-binding protein YcdF (DUF218 family)
MFLLKKILLALILPPAGPTLLALFGLWLTRSKSRLWRGGGLWLGSLSLLALLILSLPVVGKVLNAGLERYPPISPDQLRQVQAIVVLGGGSYYSAPEYGGDTVSHATLERLRYAARLARDSHLPLLVSGGAPYGGRAEGESMREVLEHEFGVKVRWVEVAARDTGENASLAAPILKRAGIRRVALLSHAWHLARAIPLFEKEGLEVTPAPMGFSTSPPSPLLGFLPGGLGQSREALHEYLGQFSNRMKE